MSLEWFLDKFGYLAILVGTFFEGETVLVLGGLTAKLGYLNLAGVIAAAFAGTLIGDQLYFFLGRRYGRSFLERKPAWRLKGERVSQVLERHPRIFLVGFRFLYGLRTVSPFMVGMSSLSTRRFIGRNLVGASVWAAAIGGLGYAFGHGVELVLGNVKHYEKELLLGVALCGILVWAVHFFRQGGESGNTKGEP